MNKGHLKRFLHYVLCIFFAPHHSPRDMKDRVCGLFAKHLERSRIAAFCSDKNPVFVSRNRALRAVRFCSVVILQTLLEHAATPISQSQSEIVLPCTRSSNGSSRSRIASRYG